MKFLNKYNTIMLLIIVFILFSQTVDAQCAMCKAAAESNLKHNGNSIARGLNPGILYLMAVPYLLLIFIFRKQLKYLFTKLFSKKQPVISKQA